jgi:uncharacterized protein
MSAERPPLEEMTLRQLRRVASELNVSRYSRMRKDQLLAAIQEAQRIRFSPSPSRTLEAQAEVEAAKFDVGQTDLVMTSLAVVDEGLPDLPAGYADSRIVLMPRDPQWAYAYWDIPNAKKQELRQQGGIRLALRFYDVTNIDLNFQRPHSLQQYECDELAREWYLPVPVSDRDYVIEIGYITADGRWLLLAQSEPMRVPPVYPSDWIDDQFVTIGWDEELQGKTFLQLSHPTRRSVTAMHDKVFEMAQAAEAQRVAGSVFGSVHQVPEEAVSSYVFPSGIGKWAEKTESGVGMYTTSGMGMSGVGMAARTESGVGMMSGVGMAARTESGVGMMSGVGMYTTSGMGMMSGVGMAARTESGVGIMSGVGMYTTSGAGMSGVGMYTTSGMGMSGVGMGLSALTTSGVGMSGVGMYTTSGMGMSGVGMGAGMYTMSGMGMSGVGFSASMPPIRPRQFWLIADAELIVYGATEPDATVTIGGRPIKLNPDGTFRFQMSFQDGLIDYPIMAVAADGEQMRSIHMKFNRETPERNTNTKEEAIPEWLP